MHELKLAYYAGLFDGEGCVRIANQYRKVLCGKGKGHVLWVMISMTDPIVLYELRKDFGGGSKVYMHSHLAKVHHKRLYSWIVTSRNAEKFLQAIHPYVWVKKDQVELALKFQNRVDSVKARKHNPLTGTEYDIREEFKLRLQALKHVVVHGATIAMGANSGNGENPNPELTRRQSLKCVETIDPPQDSSWESRDEIVHSNGN